VPAFTVLPRRRVVEHTLSRSRMRPSSIDARRSPLLSSRHSASNVPTI
jgi:hypothetical protein